MINEQVPMKEFTLTTVIKNYHHLERNKKMHSSEVNHFNVPWAIEYCKKGNGLAAGVYCGKPNKDEGWSIDTKMELFVIASNGKWDRYDLRRNTEFGTNRDDSDGMNELIPDNDYRFDYLVKNEVIVEIKVQILRMSGIDEKRKLKSFDDENAKRSSDMTLFVNDRQFHVSKHFLANQSTHFSSLVFEKARKKLRLKITLNDVDANAFQTFLEVIYLESTLTDSCVEDVLHLAIKYDSKNVTRICEEFLLHSSKLSTKQKIRIGIQFNLENLKKSCIDSLESAADVRAVLGYEGSSDAIKDPQVLRHLILRYLSFR